MIHTFLLAFDTLYGLVMTWLLSPTKSNPKQATKRLGVWWLFIGCFGVSSPTWAQSSSPVLPASSQFVSLSLCSDRLLTALAAPQQIAAMSPYSTNPLFMLDKVNTDKPTLRPTLSDLLPYINSTILLNETFYPRLVKRLKALGFKIIGINDNPQTPEELFELMRQLASLTGQTQQAETLITTLSTALVDHVGQRAEPPKKALLLSENGGLNLKLPQFQTLLSLMNYQAVNTIGNQQQQANALEDILLSDPQVLVKIHSSSGYSDKGKWLNHKALQHFGEGKTTLTLPTKYTYCFDHGVWQGAAVLQSQ